MPHRLSRVVAAACAFESDSGGRVVVGVASHDMTVGDGCRVCVVPSDCANEDASEWMVLLSVTSEAQCSAGVSERRESIG